MINKETKLTEISNKTERDIIELIGRNKKCLLGEILMKLKLSYQNGYQTVQKLMDQDIISNAEVPPYYTLKIELN